MGIETEIETALFTSLTEALAEIDEELQVAWPNRPFEPSNPSVSYVRVDHLRNRNTRLFVKGADPHLRQGILQLTAVTPLLVGVDAAVALVDALAAQFPADLDLFGNGVRVRIQAAPDIATPTREDASWDVVCSIPYECLA